MGMRGDERVQEGMFSYVSLAQRVPADHPLREVRKLTGAVLGSLSPGLDALYAEGIVILETNDDPRSGKTRNELADIVRGEPDVTQYRPPADYVVRELQMP